jgi:hypothetical protein
MATTNAPCFSLAAFCIAFSRSFRLPDRSKIAFLASTRFKSATSSHDVFFQNYYLTRCCYANRYYLFVSDVAEKWN